MNLVPGRSLPGVAVHATGELNMVPPMNLGEYRESSQPPGIRSAAMDDNFVWLTKRQVDSLMEYSSSYPTGTAYGKCWKRADADGGYWLCWYIPCSKPNKVGINYRIIIITN
jgi:hypothetical protein